MNSVAEIAKDIILRWRIEPKNIVGHADVAPSRKEDPSGYFDWKHFYENLGILNGLYDSSLTPTEQNQTLLSAESGNASSEVVESIRQMQTALKE